MRVDRREFVWVFSTLMSWSNENKSYIRVDESWQARVCVRVFSTLMSWSNENKSYIRADESWQARVCVMRVGKRQFVWVFSTLMSWSNENKNYIKVDKSWPAKVCMRVFPGVLMEFTSGTSNILTTISKISNNPATNIYFFWNICFLWSYQARHRIHYQPKYKRGWF